MPYLWFHNWHASHLHLGNHLLAAAAAADDDEDSEIVN